MRGFSFGSYQCYHAAVSMCSQIPHIALSMRGATCTFVELIPDYHFNPRSPRGERPLWEPIGDVLIFYFNPRSPYGERLRMIQKQSYTGRISIHAPLAGSDRQTCLHRRRAGSYFNPRSPRGERPGRQAPVATHTGNFNPRSPRGERLGNIGVLAAKLKISIHAPLAGSDHGQILFIP